MKVVADLQIHSKYSMATSSKMEIPTLARYAVKKGLNILGTGDIQHPKWFSEVSQWLVEEDDSGLYVLRNEREPKVRFMVTTEFSTVYEQEGKARKVHHCVLLPSLEVAAQVADSLKGYGDLESDGRPILNMSSPELVERLVGVSDLIEVFPAHSWTPWWSVFGFVNGFDSMKECYEDKLKKIHALETGLSSDPPMNWRISQLHEFILLSNSDCHSPYPHRLGREANIFELPKLSYLEVIEVIRKGDTKRVSTVETKPEYGKYHWTGHRACGVSMPGEEAVKIGNKCPKCGRRLTKGVEQRVEELADCEKGFMPDKAQVYKHLLPLQELIASVLSTADLFSRSVLDLYDKLIEAFRNEFTVVLDIPIKDIKKVAGQEVAKAIEYMREDRMEVEPGYDGVYGRIRPVL